MPLGRRWHQPEQQRLDSVRASACVPEDRPASGCAASPPSPPSERGCAGVSLDDSDEALLVRAARRDVDALAELYDRHRAVAYGMALRVTGSVPAAEDVVQEAFLGAWRHAAGFDASKGSARSWLLAIVHHRAIDAIRRRRSSDPLPDVDTAPPAALVVPDPWPEVAGNLDAAAVRRAVATLPETQRNAIELAYWGGLTQAEIAERQGLPLGTVKGRIRLGLQGLARALRDADDAGVGGAAAGGVGAAAVSEPGPTGRIRAVMARISARVALGVADVRARQWSAGR